MVLIKNIFLLLLIILVVTSCGLYQEDEANVETVTADKLVEFGDQVTVEYIVAFEDGTIVDRSSDYDIPVMFAVGSKQVIPGLEKSVLGMRLGEEKQVIISPEAGYGVRDPDLVRTVPLEQFTEGPDLKEGMSLTMELDNGKKVSAQVFKLAEDVVILDLNHPLAGKNLIFNILVTDIQRD